MRDPVRIALILAKFSELWNKTPDHRFCQLIEQIVMPLMQKNGRPLHSIEDTEFISAMKAFDDEFLVNHGVNQNDVS